MTEKLMNLCNELEIEGEVITLIESIENCYKVIFKGDMVQWINENINNKNLDCLNRRERFFYLLKDLNAEIMCKYALGINKGGIIIEE